MSLTQVEVWQFTTSARELSCLGSIMLDIFCQVLSMTFHERAIDHICWKLRLLFGSAQFKLLSECERFDGIISAQEKWHYYKTMELIVSQSLQHLTVTREALYCRKWTTLLVLALQLDSHLQICVMCHNQIQCCWLTHCFKLLRMTVSTDQLLLMASQACYLVPCPLNQHHYVPRPGCLLQLLLVFLLPLLLLHHLLYWRFTLLFVELFKVCTIYCDLYPD